MLYLEMILHDALEDVRDIIQGIKCVGLRRYVKLSHEARMKSKMDREAQDAYVYECGCEEGRRLALQAEIQSIVKLISKMKAGGDADKIAQLSDPKVLETMMKKYEID